MSDGVQEANSDAALARIPANLPIYLFSGAADPVHGERVHIDRLVARMHLTGLRPVLKFYPQARHETLNEQNRDVVFTDTLSWIDELDCMSGIGGSDDC